MCWGHTSCHRKKALNIEVWYSLKVCGWIESEILMILVFDHPCAKIHFIRAIPYQLVGAESRPATVEAWHLQPDLSGTPVNGAARPCVKGTSMSWRNWKLLRNKRKGKSPNLAWCSYWLANDNSSINSKISFQSPKPDHMHEFTSQELNAILQATKKYEEAGPAKMHFLWPFFFVQK